MTSMSLYVSSDTFNCAGFMDLSQKFQNSMCTTGPMSRVTKVSILPDNSTELNYRIKLFHVS